MKKLLLLGALAGMMLNASADVTVQAPKHISHAPQGNMQSIKIDAATIAKMKHAAPRAAEGENSETLSMNYTLAGEPNTAFSYEEQTKGDRISMAFEIDPETATKFAGNEITRIFYNQGTRLTALGNNTNRNQIKDATVFLTYDLQEQPFMTAKAVTTSTAWGEIFVELPEAYKIEAGKRVFVGVTSVLTSAYDLAIVVDYEIHDTDMGGWVAFNGEWDNITDEGGFCCVGAEITGTTLPTNILDLESLWAQPVTTYDSAFPLRCVLRNNAANYIESFELCLTVGDDEPIVRTLTTSDLGIKDPFSYSKALNLTLAAAYQTPGPNQVPIKLQVTKVNGKDNLSTIQEHSTSTLVLDPATAFDRTVVIEEFTGTWCGWCPRGIVGMEYVAKNYSRDKVISIAAHYNDPMAVGSYFPVIEKYASSFPSAAISRIDVIDPSTANFKSAIESFSALPTVGTIIGSATFNADSTKVTIDTESTFCYDYTGSRFGIEYVLIEDSVGPYYQKNYYAGGGAGALSGWQYKDEDVETIFNEVACSLDTYGGVVGSVPATISAGTAYSNSYETTVPATVQNAANLHAIALLVDRVNGVIVNAVQCEIAADPAGVSNVSLDGENAPVEYFNLQGIRVENPQAGIFIRRQGKTVSKVAL